MLYFSKIHNLHRLTNFVSVLVKTFGSAVHGIQAITITIEVNLSGGKPNYFIVGLPDNAVRESLQRVEAALQTNNFRMPRQKIVVNLAPADIRKEGSAYDLPIATAILASSGQIEAENLEKYIIMGELSLDGGLQPIKGALPIAIQARKEGFKGFILPKQNAREAAIVNDIEVYGGGEYYRSGSILQWRNPVAAGHRQYT